MRMHKYLKAGSDRLGEAILRIRSVVCWHHKTRSNENKTVLFVFIVNDLKLCLYALVSLHWPWLCGFGLACLEFNKSKVFQGG